MSLQFANEITPVIKVERKSIRGMFNAILYRGWQDNGEHSDAFCVELQFRNKKDAITWLKKQHISFYEIEDHEELPWISNDNYD